MKVTLIFAAVGIAGFNPNRQPGDREGSWISHGLASIGTVLKEQGHEVDLIDLRQLSGFDDFKTRIAANPSEIYGIQLSPVDLLAGYRTVYDIKTTLPKAKIIVGGLLPTLFPEKFDFKVIDTVFMGEGEVTFPKIIKDYENGIPFPKTIKGERPNLDKLPWMDREFFDYDKEMTCSFAPFQPLPTITMLAGRGCPFQCAFCQPAENIVFGRPYRLRSVDNVLGEMRYLHDKYKYRSASFWDDTFTVNRHWVDEFCNKYDIPASLSVNCRADIICNNEPMIEKMSKSGVEWLAIGFESGSQRLLNLIKKGTTVEENLKAARICRKHGIKIFAAFMLGLPTETPEESLMTEKMINEIDPEWPSGYWYTPIPGTRLYNYCKEQDLFLHNMEEETIERTSKFVPQIKNIDYNLLTNIMERHDFYVYGKCIRKRM